MAVAPVQFLTDNLQVLYYESAFTGFEIGSDDQTSERHLQVGGGQLLAFTQAMKGWTEFELGRNVLHRFPPEMHPIFPAHYVDSVSYLRELAEPSPFGPGQTLQYDLTELSVKYRAFPGVAFLDDTMSPGGFTSEEWRYCRIERKANLEGRPISRMTLAYNIDNKMVNEPLSQIVQSRTWKVHFLQIPILFTNSVPALPGALQANIDACCGAMNSDVILNCYPQSLLLIDYDLEYRMMANGQPAADVIYTILERGGSVDASGVPLMNVGTQTPDHTRILKPDGLYYRVYRVSDGTKVKSIYPGMPFKKLFQFV